MGILRSVFKRQETWTPMAGRGGVVIGGNSSYTMSSAGQAVTESTALTIPAVFLCVRVIGEDIAKLPLVLYRRIDTAYGPGWEEATDHPVYRALRIQPNDEMAPFEAIQAIAISAAMWGNGYAKINRRRSQAVDGYTPLPPWRVKVERDAAGRLVYVYNPGGDMPKQRLRADQIIHIKGPTVDGLVGWMIAGLGAEAIGVGLAAAKFTGSFFSNGASLKGIVTLPTRLRPEEFKEFTERFREQYEGAENQNKTAIFDNGATYNTIGSTPKDAEMINTLRYSLEDIARIFRVNPNKLYDRSRAQGWSTLELLNLEHLTDTLMPWLCRIAQEIGRKMLTEQEREQYRLEHQYDYLMVADAEARASYFSSALTNGWMNRNEVRARVNMNPIEGGEVYQTQLNMGPADRGASQADDDQDDSDDDDQDQQPADNRVYTREAFAHAMQRVVGREVSAAARKAGDHAAMQAWAADWYPRQREYMIDEMRIPARTLALLNNTPTEAADQAVENFIDQHIQESRRLLAETPAAALQDELARWHSERAPWAAHHLQNEVHNERRPA